MNFESLLQTTSNNKLLYQSRMFNGDSVIAFNVTDLLESFKNSKIVTSLVEIKDGNTILYSSSRKIEEITVPYKNNLLFSYILRVNTGTDIVEYQVKYPIAKGYEILNLELELVSNFEYNTSLEDLDAKIKKISNFYVEEMKSVVSLQNYLSYVNSTINQIKKELEDVKTEIKKMQVLQ